MPRLFAKCRECGAMKHLSVTRENRLRAHSCDKCGGKLGASTRHAFVAHLREIIRKDRAARGRAQLKLVEVEREAARQARERARFRRSSTASERGHPLRDPGARDQLDI